MVPGKSSCPAGFTREYYGYLMSERVHTAHKRSTFECVDKDLESVHGSSQYAGILVCLVLLRLCVMHSLALLTTTTKRSTVLCAQCSFLNYYELNENCVLILTVIVRSRLVGLLDLTVIKIMTLPYYMILISIFFGKCSVLFFFFFF